MSERSDYSRKSVVVAFFGVSFILHLAWEVAQMPLYVSPNRSFWEDFRMCLYATATGDMLFMLTLYLTIAVIHQDFWWPMHRVIYAHPGTWVVPVLVGVLLAVSFELWAIHAARRWEYDSMPMIPVLHVGLTPVLQMILIPLATLSICRRMASR